MIAYYWLQQGLGLAPIYVKIAPYGSLSRAGHAGFRHWRMRMVKAAKDFVCQSCGAISAKWQGKCPACGAWNSLSQEGSALTLAGPAGLKSKRKAKTAASE